MASPLTLAKNALDALTALNSVGPAPTDDERAAMALWPGWGPLAPAFAQTPEGRWSKIADELDTLVSAADLNMARENIDTSFYTSPEIVAAVFDLLRATGFTAGEILEPGCGSGNFLTHTPADMDITWTGVEIDPVAARLAAALNPDANIIVAPMQKTPLRAGRFDAVIGNVPFSSATVHDSAYTSASLHEYFILRAIDAVRPGGYVIVITSRHMLDGERALNQINTVADLMSAVRLPSGTFDGTAVTADILVLRKHEEISAAGDADAERGAGWKQTFKENPRHYGYGAPAKVRETLTITTGEATADVSSYWADRPECVAGEFIATGFYRAPLKVVAAKPAAAITRAVKAAAAYIVPASPRTVKNTLDDVILADAEGRKAGSFHLIDDTIMQVQDGQLAPVRDGKELRHLIALRDVAVKLIDLESEPGRADDDITPARAAALAQYQAYVAAFGPLNRGTLVEGKPDADTGEPALSWRRPALGGFRKDPDYVAVLALENFNQETGDASPAPILLRRVGAHPPRVTSASSVEEALAITLGESGQINVHRIAELVGNTDTDAILAGLGDRVFRDPGARGALTLDRDYLAGNVREKLAVAEVAAGSDDSYQRNVTALSAVMPEQLTPVEIRVQLGASWITPEDVSDFTRDVFEYHRTVSFTPAIAVWELDTTVYMRNHSVQLTYGTARFNPFELLQIGLNSKAPIVWDERYNPVTDRTTRVRNQEQTLAAEEKLRAIQDRFAEWVWEDEKRATRLAAEYNRRFNSHVVRRGDGSYLTFPGMDPSINLWPHQRDAVDRIISGERILIGHVPGAGKTKSMIAGALTLRRMGLARKPLIGVPGHLLEQIAREAKQAYPTGRFLIASKEDLTKENRRLFAARCATGDWDAVVMTHQAFTSIPVAPEAEERWVEGQKSDLKWHMMNGSSGGSRGAKQIATAVRKLEERITALRDGASDPDAITFEQLGVDHISIDEAHMARRLPIATRAEGFSMGSSKRATDLLLKIDTLAERRPGKPIVALFTGTPWSNTLAETYVWQRFLQPDRLIAAGVEHFDSWAATFVRYESRVEVTPDGSGFRLYRRPSVIQNVPELRGMLAEVADLLTADDIGLERPNATWETVVSAPGPEQAAFVTDLARRSDAIRSGGKPARPNGEGEDNMLIVCNDGRQVALDPRLVGIYEDSTKLEDAAQRIYRQYLEGKDIFYGDHPVPGSFQLVLCDVGTPRPDDSQSYGRLRLRLIELGIPAKMVRFVHEAKSDKARDLLFAQCREGGIAVLFGSTDKVGTGVNIQTRLREIHSLDAPWHPSAVTQREGRGLRPGNLNKFITLIRYVTERSFDAFMYQKLEAKARFIAQMYIADGTVREIDDVGAVVLNFAEVKALAAGNPDLLRQAELSNEVRRLRTLRSLWVQSLKRLQDAASDDRRDADTLRSRAASIAEALRLHEEADPNRPSSMESLVNDIKRGNGYGRAYWRGLTLRIENDRYGVRGARSAGTTISIESSYSHVGDFTLTKKDIRKPEQALATLILSRANEWVKTAPAEPQRLLALAEAKDESASSAEKTARTSTFEHMPALAAAERDLDIVEEKIEQSVELASIAAAA